MAGVEMTPGQEALGRFIVQSLFGSRSGYAVLAAAGRITLDAKKLFEALGIDPKAKPEVVFRRLKDGDLQVEVSGYEPSERDVENAVDTIMAAADADGHTFEGDCPACDKDEAVEADFEGGFEALKAFLEKAVEETVAEQDGGDTPE